MREWAKPHNGSATIICLNLSLARIEPKNSHLQMKRNIIRS